MGDEMSRPHGSGTSPIDSLKEVADYVDGFLFPLTMRQALFEYETTNNRAKEL
jgi:hypothetical protein